MLRFLVRRGLRRGLMDGSRAWLVAGAAAGVVMLARRVLDEPPEVVFREQLEPGDGLLVRVLPGGDDPTA